MYEVWQAGELYGTFSVKTEAENVARWLNELGDDYERATVEG